MTYPHFFAQPPGETSHDYTPCFSTAVAAAPPSVSHPGRSRPDGAASGGSGRPCRRGPAADLCGGHGGRGRFGTAVAPEGFSGRFGSGSGEVTEGVRTLAADFRAVLWDVEWYSYLLFKSTFCEIRVKEMR